jgi:hypothetical protein
VPGIVNHSDLASSVTRRLRVNRCFESDNLAVLGNDNLILLQVFDTDIFISAGRKNWAACTIRDAKRMAWGTIVGQYEFTDVTYPYAGE